MNLKLIVMIMAVTMSTSAVAARVESEQAQSYGDRANSTRIVISATSAPEGEICDPGRPVTAQLDGPSTGAVVARAVCPNV